VAALVDAIGEPVFALGHSYGAEIILGALLLTRNIGKFVHYEGGIPAVYPTPVPRPHPGTHRRRRPGSRLGDSLSRHCRN
jgi:pimeloyl-ACP methyl ester carboxylesterase